MPPEDSSTHGNALPSWSAPWPQWVLISWLWFGMVIVPQLAKPLAIDPFWPVLLYWVMTLSLACWVYGVSPTLNTLGLWPTLNTPITGKIVTRWLGLGLLYAGMMLGLGVLFTGFIPDWAHTTDQLKSTSITPQNIVTAVWVSPWLEELIFRGGLLGSYCGSITQGTLWERLKRAWLPLLLISGLFTVCHSHYTTSSIALIFVMGQALLLGMARLHTGTLWAPILMHTLNNALSLYGWP